MNNTCSGDNLPVTCVYLHFLSAHASPHLQQPHLVGIRCEVVRARAMRLLRKEEQVNSNRIKAQNFAGKSLISAPIHTNNETSHRRTARRTLATDPLVHEVPDTKPP